MAIGMRQEFGPMADLATEPRWRRISEVMGSQAVWVNRLVRAQVYGMQHSTTGDIRTGISATLKHWPGHGPMMKGMDAHSQYGRYTVFPGGAFKYHLIPFQYGFDAGATGIMPNFSIAKSMWDINPLQIPTAFVYEMITMIAKKQQGFDGLITNDWCTTGTCAGGGGVSSPAGGNGYNMEGMTYGERAALHLHAGSHQLGNEDPIIYKDAYDQGLITMADIDYAVSKILEMPFKLGVFENPYVDDTVAANELRSAANRQLAFDAMRRSVVLLQNADHLGGSNRYLPILGSRSYVDTNANGTVEVYYDGVVDSIQQGAATDFMQDVSGTYDYT